MSDPLRSFAVLMTAGLAAAGALGAAQHPPVAVHLQPAGVVGVGEPVELTFEIASQGVRSAQLTPHFEVENLRVEGGPSRRDSISWVNGVLSRQTAVSWTLVALQPGEARVTGIAVRSGEETYTFPERTLQVTAEPRRPAPGGYYRANDPFDEMLRGLFGPPRRRHAGPVAEPELILRAEVDVSRPYVGQQVVYTLYLLTERRRPGEGRVQVETIYPRNLPSFTGFWSEDVPLPDRSRVELVDIGSKTFFRQPVLRRALFALREGPATLDEAEVELRLVTMLPGMFGEEPLRPAATTRQSNPIGIEVRPLPPPPPGFSGAVGAFHLEGELLPAQVEAGEAANLTLRLHGTGNLHAIPAPEPPTLPGVRRFPARQESTVEPDGARLRSRRSWSWPLVPERAGRWEVPPMEWTFFDPATDSYGTLQTPPLQLAMIGEPVLGAEPGSPAQAGPSAALSPEKVPATAETAPWAGNAPLVLTAALLALTALPLGVVLWRRLKPGCPLRRQLSVRLQQAARETRPRQAAAAAESAWREFLAQRWQIPHGTPCSRWEPLLSRRGVQGPTARELIRLMDDLHYLRYAPQLATTAPLQEELLERSQRLVRQLP